MEENRNPNYIIIIWDDAVVSNLLMKSTSWSKFPFNKLNSVLFWVKTEIVDWTWNVFTAQSTVVPILPILKCKLNVVGGQIRICSIRLIRKGKKVSKNSIRINSNLIHWIQLQLEGRVKFSEIRFVRNSFDSTPPLWGKIGNTGPKMYSRAHQQHQFYFQTQLKAFTTMRLLLAVLVTFLIPLKQMEFFCKSETLIL